MNMKLKDPILKLHDIVKNENKSPILTMYKNNLEGATQMKKIDTTKLLKPINKIKDNKFAQNLTIHAAIEFVKELINQSLDD